MGVFPLFRSAKTLLRIGVLSLSGLLFSAACCGSADAQAVGIAAVVNDQVISIADLSARVGLVLASSNIPDTNETRARIEPQVMRQLIDEKLELQEAKHEGVTLNDGEMDHQLASIAHGNHVDPSQMDKFLAEHHIEKDALVAQLTAQTLWARTVQRRYGHLVSVGDDEVAETVKAITRDAGKPQNRISEVFLSVDTPQQDQEVKTLADRLFQEIQKGAPFAAVARQFSQSPSAAAGGDIGWVLPGTLDPEVEKIVSTMQPRMMTRPLRLAGGYYLYLLLDRRMPEAAQSNVVMDLAQVVFPLAADADADTRDKVSKQAADATADLQTCGEMNRLGQKTSPDLSGPISNVGLPALPEDLRSVVADAEVAKPTKPIAVRGGIGVFMVCRREGGQKIDRDQVESSLRSERLENIARRYLADLRRVAYIDLRV